MVKVKTLRPLQTYITLIVPNKHPSQARTLKLHMNPCNNHHRCRVTTLQHLSSTILLPRIFIRTNLVFLEAAKTTYTLILLLITQKQTDIDVCKILTQLPLYAILFLYFYYIHRFPQTSFKFCHLVAYICTSRMSTKTNRIATFKIIYIIRNNGHPGKCQDEKNGISKQKLSQQ